MDLNELNEYTKEVKMKLDYLKENIGKYDPLIMQYLDEIEFDIGFLRDMLKPDNKE